MIWQRCHLVLSSVSTSIIFFSPVILSKLSLLRPPVWVTWNVINQYMHNKRYKMFPLQKMFVSLFYILSFNMHRYTLFGILDEELLFTGKGHHCNASVTCTTQNMFQQSKVSRTIRLNALYMILFPYIWDKGQIKVLT